MLFWFSVIIFFFILGLLVFIHELGHFLAAKAVGAKVEEFAFGFGPRIISKKIGETEYRINVIPAGGYVKILGELLSSEIDVNSQEAKGFWKEENLGSITDEKELVKKIESSKLSKEDKKQLKERGLEFLEAKYSKRSFSNKTVPQRFLVLVAGVSMNFILAVFIFSLYLSLNNFMSQELPKAAEYRFIGAETTLITKPLIEQVYSEELRRQSIEGALIWELNGKKVENKEEVMSFLDENPGQEADFGLFTEQGLVYKKLILNTHVLDTTLDEEVRGRILISTVVEEYPAANAGIKAGSILLELNDRPITASEQLLEELRRHEGQEVTMKILDENGMEKDLTIKLLVREEENDPILGAGFRENIIESMEFYNLDYSKNKITSGFSHTVNILGYQVKVLSVLIQRSFEQRSVAPVGLAVGSVATVADSVNTLVETDNFVNIINLTGLVSVALAFMNILPIPLFDGGHILFLVIEKIRGRKLSPRKEEIISTISFIFIIALSIAVLLKDIVILNWSGRFAGFVRRLSSGDTTAREVFSIGLIILFAMMVIWRRKQIVSFVFRKRLG